MKRILYCFLLCVLLNTGTRSQTVNRNYVDGKIYLRLSKELFKNIASEPPLRVSPARLGRLSALIEKYGVTRIQRPFYQAWEDEVLSNTLRLEFSDKAGVNKFIEELSGTPGVIYAEKVPLMKTDAVPNDPLYSGQTHLGQINAPQAWNIFNSTANGTSSITVAIVDNAVMWTHADLVANTYTNTAEIPANNIDDDGNGYIDDVNGYDVSDLDNNTVPTNLNMLHGTHCAGIAGARTDNSIGIASIGWNIKIIPVKCETDGGGVSSVSNGYEGIIYAARAKARIISCSWGGSAYSITEQNVIDFAWVRGSIIIASAGNNGTSAPGYPGAYNNVYCVAWVDNNDVKNGLSSYGSWVDICAPGTGINSTVPYTPTASPAYQLSSGTSMATPLVAGLAALMLSKSPNMTRANVLNCISTTAANVYSLSGNSSYVSGNQLGAGRIDAFAAMNCALSYTAHAPVANFFAFPLYTCPGSTVQMTDSSLYQPTSWNWTFQGGTPATSTLANPVVQWSAPGTYSVALTVANASGTNTATKLSYVTVAGPLALPFTEGFQGSQFLPANWSANNIWNDAVFWERRTGVGGFGSSTACAVFDNYNYITSNDRDEMRSPKFNFSGVALAKLKFDVAYARYDALTYDSLEVKLSTNCGSTWTQIYIQGGSTLATAPDNTSQFVPASTEWRTEIIDVSALAAGQGNVMFSFINRGHYGQGIYLDNINLFTPSPTLSISGPTAACAGTPVSFSVTNTGASSYTWSLPSSSLPTSTLANPGVTYSTPGTYTLAVIGTNGTASTVVTRTITVASSPTISVNSPSICAGTSAVLTASGASTYSWNNVSGPASYTVSPTTTSIYTLSGSNAGACVASMTVAVNVNASPTLAVNNQTICPSGTATLLANGASTYSWSTGATGNSVAVSPAATTIYTITGYTGNCSDTKTLSVTIGSGLSVFIASSASVICSGSQATLTASGASNYSWSTGSSAASLIISPGTGLQSYSVTGTSASCSGTAAVTVSTTASPTLALSALPSTLICAGSSVTLSASGASNYTWSAGGTGSQVIVSPGATSIYTVTGTTGVCSGSKTIAISAGGSTFAVQLSVSPPTVCVGTTFTVNASGGVTYTWSSGSGNASIAVTPTSAGPLVYQVAASNSGCSSNGSITVNVNGLPLSVLSVTNSGCATCGNGAISSSVSGGTPPYTYTWVPAGGNAPAAGSLTPGCYTLHVTDSKTCVNTNTACVDIDTGIGEQTNGNSLLLSPNPAEDMILLSIPGRFFSAVIYDELGRKVLEQKTVFDNVYINAHSLAKGIYMVEALVNGHRIQKKLVVD